MEYVTTFRRAAFSLSLIWQILSTARFDMANLVNCYRLNVMRETKQCKH